MARRSALSLLLFVILPVGAAEFQDGFSDGSENGWVEYDGNWYVSSQEYHIDPDSYGGKTRVGNNTYTNLIYEADVTVSPGSWETGIIFRANGFGTGDASYSGYGAAIDQGGRVLLIRGPGYNVIGQAAASIQANRSYRLQVWAVKDRILVYLDNVLRIDVRDGTYASGYVGLFSYSAAARFDNVLATSETQYAARDDFNDGNEAGWVEHDGGTTYSVLNGKYVSSGSGSPKSILDNSSYVDYILHSDVTLTSGNGDAGLLFRVTESGAGSDNFKGYYVSMGRIPDLWPLFFEIGVDRAIFLLYISDST